MCSTSQIKVQTDDFITKLLFNNRTDWQWKGAISTSWPKPSNLPSTPSWQIILISEFISGNTLYAKHCGNDVAMCCTHLQVATVDLIHNFKVTRQQMSKEVNWPALQSFRKNGVIGVGTGAHTNVPGLNTSRRQYAHVYINILLCKTLWK